MEPRLQHRYAVLVQQHVHAAGKLTPGPSAPAETCSAFAATQAAWRFLHNESVTLPRLIEPLQQVARQWRQFASGWALVVHDWSVLSYPTHRSKADRVQLGSEHSWGYDLGTMLLVDGDTGAPVAPLAMSLRAAQSVCSTQTPAPALDAPHLDAIGPAMHEVARLGLGERVVHVIDEEADALAYYRQWHADRHYFLVRADGRRKVRWQGVEVALAELGQRLQAQGHGERSREVTYRRQQAIQHVAETTVVLDRPAWRHRRRGSQRINQRVPGKPIALRLIVSRVCDASGTTVAVWYLLTNVPSEVTAATAALWYYWRWRIESFFKLLKEAGQQVEQWQQETAAAIARRLLVAAMACVLVWKLERATAVEDVRFREFLVRLSGRQMKRGKRHTAPALLGGLYVYLTMLEVLEHHSVAELQGMRKHVRLKDLDTG